MDQRGGDMITADEFYRREISIFGEDEIFDLIEKGYSPVLTNRGWKWLRLETGVDIEQDLCYNDSARVQTYSRSSGISVTDG